MRSQARSKVVAPFETQRHSPPPYPAYLSINFKPTQLQERRRLRPLLLLVRRRLLEICWTGFFGRFLVCPTGHSCLGQTRNSRVYSVLQYAGRPGQVLMRTLLERLGISCLLISSTVPKQSDPRIDPKILYSLLEVLP